jgi:two-component system OmpR family response regulator
VTECDDTPSDAEQPGNTQPWEVVDVPRRLLLVDGSDRARMLACLSLERTGDWFIVPATSGEQALDLMVAIGPFDVVMMDVLMSGMSGPSTLEGLRDCGLPADVPIIFFAEKAQATERRSLLFLGAVGVIDKPLNPVAFPGQVEQLLNT